MSYAAWSVIAGEQPTTSKWNILGTNDASFNAGTGFANNVIKSPLLALSNALDPSNGVQTQANAGTAGGTMFYVNLGGIKLLWGETATISTSNATTNVGITYPVGFFNSVQAGSITATALGSVATQFANFNGDISASTTSVFVYVFCTTASGTAKGTYFIVGT